MGFEWTAPSIRLSLILTVETKERRKCNKNSITSLDQSIWKEGDEWRGLCVLGDVEIGNEIGRHSLPISNKWTRSDAAAAASLFLPPSRMMCIARKQRITHQNTKCEHRCSTGGNQFVDIDLGGRIHRQSKGGGSSHEKQTIAHGVRFFTWWFISLSLSVFLFPILVLLALCRNWFEIRTNNRITRDRMRYWAIHHCNRLHQSDVLWKDRCI